MRLSWGFDNTLTKKSNLKRHLQEQPDLFDTNCEVKRAEKQLFIRNVCEKAFNRKSTLMIHIKSHNENRTQYKCSKCEETFLYVKNLKRHEKEQHTMGHRCIYYNVDLSVKET